MRIIGGLTPGKSAGLSENIGGLDADIVFGDFKSGNPM
jgi:hypothetical protein